VKSEERQENLHQLRPSYGKENRRYRPPCVEKREKGHRRGKKLRGMNKLLTIHIWVRLFLATPKDRKEKKARGSSSQMEEKRATMSNGARQMRRKHHRTEGFCHKQQHFGRRKNSSYKRVISENQLKTGVKLIQDCLHW